MKKKRYKNQLDLFSEQLDDATALTPCGPAGANLAESTAAVVTPVLQTAPANFAELVACFQDAVSDHPRRAQYRSAAKRTADVLQLQLQDVPTNPAALRALLAAANPAVAGIKPRRWTQMKSMVKAAMRDVGVDVLPSRSSTPLSVEWADCMSEVEDRGVEISLSRVLRFFTSVGIGPGQVTPESFVRFRQSLTEASLIEDAEKAYRQTAKHWNKAVATVPGWPSVRIEPESDPRRFSFEWHELPETFTAESKTFVAAKSDSHPLDQDYAKPTRPATATARLKSLRSLGSALILSGQITIDELTSLEVLTRPEHVRAALRYLSDVRAKGTFTEGHINYAWLARTVSKYWLKDEARTQELKEMVQNLTTHVRKDKGMGMTPKNRERLLQFCIAENVDALISLPLKVYRATRGVTEPSDAQSVRVMRALQVGMLTFVPIRSGNLVKLELGKHIIDVGKGTKRVVRIHLPAEITKTYRDYNAPLPSHLYPLLDSWTKLHRSRISLKPSRLLFPNKSGEPRSRDSMAQKLQDFVRRETGLLINAHLFRHIAAKLYLDHDPMGIEIVRQLLGHRSIKTTLEVYAELQADPAFNRMAKALLEVGYETPGGDSPKMKGR